MNLRYWAHTKAGPFSNAGGLKELLSAEPGITAKESKTTQTNEVTVRREDASWWSFRKKQEYFGTRRNEQNNRPVILSAEQIFSMEEANEV